MAIGMTYEQYWYGDPLMVRAFYKAEQLRQQRMNEEAWLHGAYMFCAIDATVGNMMRKNKADAVSYPSKPFDVAKPKETEQEQEDREEKEALFAKAYMTNMVMMGKNWKK